MKINFGKLLSERALWRQLLGTDTGNAVADAIESKDEAAAVAAFAMYLKKKLAR